MKRDWRQIPIPPKMQQLPKDDRGFPIPIIIMRDHTGKAHFTINDTTVVNRCAINNLCGICGNPLENDSWVLGGPMSALHERGVYIDTPIHHECGSYALQTCPYLVLSAYRSDTDKVNKLNERFGGTTLFINPTQDPNRPPFFVFAKITGWERIRGYVVPKRPFPQAEFWLAGERITVDQARSLLPPEIANRIETTCLSK